MPEEVKNNNHDFILFDSQTEYVDLMTDAQAGQLMKALYHHNRGLEVTFTDPLVQMAFMVLWQSIENSRAKRDKLRENASKGGNAKRDNQQAPSNDVANSSKGVANSNKPEQAPSNDVASTEQNDALNISVGVGVLNTPLSTDVDIPPRGEQPAKKRRKEEPPKQAYGQFQQVMLTEDEHSKLEAEFGIKGAQDMIDRLDCYIASKGVKYKNHYATIMNWHRKDVKEEQQQQAQVPALPQGVPRFSNYGQQVKWDQQQQARALLAVGDKYKDNPEDIPPEWR